MAVNIAVDVVDVTKRFRLYHEKYQSLKERVLHAGRNPYEDFWALSDISFEIAEGETVGLLGHNGSGKSTLLKCVAGILQPTEGEIRSCGAAWPHCSSSAPGSSPTLAAGRTSSSTPPCSACRRKEVDERFDEIVAFAEWSSSSTTR